MAVTYGRTRLCELHGCFYTPLLQTKASSQLTQLSVAPCPFSHTREKPRKLRK